MPTLALMAVVYIAGRSRGRSRPPGRAAFPSVRAITAVFGNSVQIGIPLAAGVFYLILTIPLTHLVNFIDKRMRSGKADTSGTLDPLEVSIVVER